MDFSRIRIKNLVFAVKDAVARSLASAASNTANSAAADASIALTAAQEAEIAANTADAKADNAATVAGAVDAKATQALSVANSANATANAASTAANSADEKATQALDNIPTKVSDLTNDSGFVNASQAADAAVFWAIYGSTTNAEIESAINSNKVVICRYNTRDYILTYRASETNHYLAQLGGNNNTRYWVRVNGNVWTNGSSSLAPLASPTFTGTPKAPTAAVGTNSTQLATTAFVKNEIENVTGSLATATSKNANVTIRGVNYRKIGKIVFITYTLNITGAINADSVELVEVTDVHGPPMNMFFIGRSAATGNNFMINMANTLNGVVIKSSGAIPAGDWSVITVCYPETDT